MFPGFQQLPLDLDGSWDSCKLYSYHQMTLTLIISHQGNEATTLLSLITSKSSLCWTKDTSCMFSEVIIKLFLPYTSGSKNITRQHLFSCADCTALIMRSNFCGFPQFPKSLIICDVFFDVNDQFCFGSEAKRIEISEGSTGLWDFQIDFQMIRRGGLLYIVSIHSRKIYSKLFGNHFQKYYICIEFKL